MKLNNGNLIVLRCANPHPKSWPGPWFKFGNPGNITGKASYKVLASYIGETAFRAVHRHFKCIRGETVRCGVYGPVAHSLGLNPARHHYWTFRAKKQK